MDPVVTKRPAVNNILPLQQYHASLSSSYLIGPDANDTDAKKETSSSSDIMCNGQPWLYYLLVVLIGLGILGLLIFIVIHITTTTTPTPSSIPAPVPIPIPIPTPTPTAINTTSLKAGKTSTISSVSSTNVRFQLQGDPTVSPPMSATPWVITNWDGATSYKATPESVHHDYTVVLSPSTPLREPMQIQVELVLLSETLKYQTAAASDLLSIKSATTVVMSEVLSSSVMVATYDRMARIIRSQPLLKIVATGGSSFKQEWNVSKDWINTIRPIPFPAQDLTVVTAKQLANTNGCANVEGICERTVDCEAQTTIMMTKTLVQVSGSVLTIDLSQVSPVVTMQVMTCASLPSVIVLGSPATSTARRNGLTLLMNQDIYQLLSAPLTAPLAPLGSLDQTLEDMLTPPVQVAASTVAEVKTIFNQTFIYNPLARAVFMAQAQRKFAADTLELQLAQCILSSKLDLHNDSPTLPDLAVLQADLCLNSDCYPIAQTCQDWLQQHGVTLYLQDLLTYLSQ